MSILCQAKHAEREREIERERENGTKIIRTGGVVGTLVKNSAAHGQMVF